MELFLRITIWAMPLLCVIANGFIFWTQKQKIQSVNADMIAVNRQVAANQKLIDEMNARKGPVRFATAVSGPSEQAAFLDLLRGFADQSGVVLTRWTNVAAAAAATQGPKEVKKSSLPLGVTPIVSKLEVGGSYERVRDFAYALMRSPRLVNLNDAKWTRAHLGETTVLGFTIIRYVTPLAAGQEPPRPVALASKPADLNSVPPVNRNWTEESLQKLHKPDEVVTGLPASQRKKADSTGF